MSPRKRAALVQVAAVTAWLVLWAAATVWADAIGAQIHPGQPTADSVGGTLILVIALVVRWQTRSWAAFFLTLLPLFGLVHSLRSFWRLPQRQAAQPILQQL